MESNPLISQKTSLCTVMNLSCKSRIKGKKEEKSWPYSALTTVPKTQTSHVTSSHGCSPTGTSGGLPGSQIPVNFQLEEATVLCMLKTENPWVPLVRGQEGAWGLRTPRRMGRKTWCGGKLRTWAGQRGLMGREVGTQGRCGFRRGAAEGWGGGKDREWAQLWNSEAHTQLQLNRCRWRCPPWRGLAHPGYEGLSLIGTLGGPMPAWWESPQRASGREAQLSKAWLSLTAPGLTE